MKRFTVYVRCEQVVADAELHPLDRENNPAGWYIFDVVAGHHVDAEQKAIYERLPRSPFHAHDPEGFVTVPTAVEADDDLPHWVPDGCHERLFPTLNDAHGAGLPREVGYRYTPDDLVLDPWVAAGDASLASLGFSEWHTGGGCWAQGLSLPTEREALFTDREGVSLPERGAGFMFGCYERDQEDRWMVEFHGRRSGLYRVYWNARILGEPEAAGAFRIQYRDPTVGQKAHRLPVRLPEPEPTFLAPGEVLRIQDVSGNVLTVRAGGPRINDGGGLLEVETGEFQYLVGKGAEIHGTAYVCNSR